MINLEFHFIDGKTLKVDSPCDVNLHTLTGSYMAFDDLFINLGNVLCIKKQEEYRQEYTPWKDSL